MQRIAELNEMKKELAKYLGERILSPHKSRHRNYYQSLYQCDLSIKPTRS